MDTPPTAAVAALEQAIDRFWETFPPVWAQVRSHVRAIVAQQGEISVEQFHILRHVRRGVRLASELAEVSQISRPAISQTLDVLVEKGLITRHHSDSDRRCVELELTGHGEAALSAIFQANRGWMLRQLATLSPEELDCVLRGLQALKKTLAGNPAS
jgi:DNA-binding MarR family transcriptional regulator